MAAETARTIAQQIGGRALFMMGARNLTDTGRGLAFKIMRNARRVTHVAVYLEPTDTYEVRFLRQKRAPNFGVEVMAEFDGVYFDQLRGLIESETGLALSL